MSDKKPYEFHGDSGNNKLYNTWGNMIQRCENPKVEQFNDYGGRGIKVCKKWRTSYSKFKKWAMKNDYSDKLTLDRENNDEGYTPDNCRWVTRSIQSQNSRMRKDNKSGYRGVMWRKQRSKWIAFINVDNKKQQLGTFDNKDDAGRCYDRYIMDNNLEHTLNFNDYRDVVIDSDHILFSVTESKQYKSDFDNACDLEDDEFDFKTYKKHFMKIVEDYVTTAEVESICYKWKIGKVKVIMSDHRNFRYDIFPEYKSKRPPSPKLRKKLKKWAMKKYHYEPNTEADDVVAYYVRKGAIGFTTDKDLLYGVSGKWFNCHYAHMCWVTTNDKDAEYFFKKQVLAGDSGDGIPSIKGVGLKTADSLMQMYGDSWDSILAIFKNKHMVLGKTNRKESYSKKYMITMTRLVCMSQWSPKKGIVLWEL